MSVPGYPGTGVRQPAGQTQMASVGSTELLVLSADAAVRDAVDASLRDVHTVHMADEAVAALDLAARYPIGIVIIDLDKSGNDIESLIDTLRELAPGMVTILAGEHDDLAELTHLTVDGTVYRFLMKPVSAGQMRLAVEAAARKLQGDAGNDPGTAAAGRSLSPPVLYAGIAALALAAGSVAWILSAPPSGPQETSRGLAVSGPSGADAPADASVDKGGPHLNRFGVILARAEQAMEEQRYVASDDGIDDDAVSLYGRVLAEDPDNPSARKGLEKIMRIFVAETREALEQGDLEAAEAAYDSASRVLPNDPRLATLQQQLVDSRVEELVAEVKADAASGDLEEAEQALSQAESMATADPEEVESARQAIEARYRAEQASRFLSLARKRLTEGRLVEPADDSALTYLRAARNNGGDAAAADEFARQLSDAMLARSRGALEEGSPALAREWLGRAETLETDLDGADELEQAIVRREAVDAERDRLLALAAERLAADKLIRPDGDSARDYLRAVQALTPGDPRAEQGLERVAEALLARAEGAFDAGDFEAAEGLLAAARETGLEGRKAADLGERIELAMAPPPEPEPEPEVVPVRRKYVPPKYPRDALLRGLEGTVAVAFTVMPDGEPEDVSVVSATPRNTFDRAAMNAVRQWQFDPVVVDGRPVAHPMQVEIEFVLNE